METLEPPPPGGTATQHPDGLQNRHGIDSMKALILAAGFGSRLRPFTNDIPKPLFTVGNHTLLDLMIHNLSRAGCRAVIVNTHHLHSQIETHIAGRHYHIPVATCFEPEILGTGGAVKNVSDFLDNDPFMVVNSDIITDIDLQAVYEFHLRHRPPVTMVLHDCPEFNNVCVDPYDHVTDFLSHMDSAPDRSGNRILAFTGIQVLDPGLLDVIPLNEFSTIIDAYRKLISRGDRIKAFIVRGHYWKDIGTPARYREAVIDHMAPGAFCRAYPVSASESALLSDRSNPPADRHSGESNPIGEMMLSFPGLSGCDKGIPNWDVTALSGDGSDRHWYRIRYGNQSLIIADHGIGIKGPSSEIGAFVSIGRHLLHNRVQVPAIYGVEMFSGLVFVEDLGDVNLQSAVHQADDTETVISLYQQVIDQLIHMSTTAADGFNPSWACQSAEYDRHIILEKECRYFAEAFIRGYLGINSGIEDLQNEFGTLADALLKFSIRGFMHRDMQSRNIMIRNGRCYFIDFQGGRIGPVQYDLASLLVDPYVCLPASVQQQLLDYAYQSLSSRISVSPDFFRNGYEYCRLSRNLQILGAFGYLTRIRGKAYFASYIPAAVNSLADQLSGFEACQFPKLLTLSHRIQKMINDGFVPPPDPCP